MCDELPILMSGPPKKTGRTERVGAWDTEKTCIGIFENAQNSEYVYVWT